MKAAGVSAGADAARDQEPAPIRGAGDPWARSMRRATAALVFMGIWTSISVYVLPQSWYTWYGKYTFGLALMHHNLTAHSALLDFFHRLVGVSYIVIAVLQFSPELRRRRPRLHRVLGRTFIGIGFLLGISGLGMAVRSFGGWSERMGNIFFGAFLLIALIRAWRLAMARNFKLHREWMIRAFAVSMGVHTLRFIYGIFIYGLPAMSPAEVLTVCTWLGYIVNLMVAEAWINHTRPQPRRAAARASASTIPATLGLGE